MATARELERELEWRKCRDDLFYFAETYWFIRVPGRGRVRLQLRPAQRELLRTFLDDRYLILLKSRQIGFSTLVALFAFWLCFFHNDRSVVMLSKGEREAMKLLGKSRYGYKHMPAWLKERGPQLVSNNLTKMEFDNDSVTESLPSKEDPARGEAVDLAIVDEWAFLENPEEAWAAIEPITDVGGAVIGGSTAKGYGNFFHEFYVSAKTGRSNFKALFFPWSANTDRNDDWYTVKAANMNQWQLHQEYPRDDVEAFIKSGNSVFDLELLSEIETLPPLRGYLAPKLNVESQAPSEKRSEFIEADNGPLRLWGYPQPGETYAIAADTAEGLEHGDYSCAHVISARTGLVIAKWHGHIDPWNLGVEVLYRLGWFYNGAIIGPEANNHGQTTCVALKDKGYPNLYYRTTYDQRSMKQTSKLGWHTQVNTKPRMIDELAQALRAGDIVLPDEETIAELMTYVREADGKMHGSPFDDQVMSLGIAVQMLRHATDAPQVEDENDYMTYDWLERLEREAEGSITTFIGAHNVRGRRDVAP